MPTPTVVNRIQYPQAISRNVWDENYQYENWESPIITAKQAGGATSGTATNVLFTKNLSLEFNPIGTQTTLAPSIVYVSEGVSALDVEMTQTAALGVELCPGILATNPMAFKMNYTNAIFHRVRFSIADVTGATTALVGIRKCEAYQADFNDYADLVGLDCVGGDIKIQSIKGGAATVTTDTTQNWADGETHELKILVDSTGLVTYQIDKAAPTVTAAYTFTSALYVVPFMQVVQGTDLSGAVNILEWECGYQS